MISLTVLFWIFVVIFAISGAMRGWAKEILVTFSVILALFILQISQIFGPIKTLFEPPNGDVEFWIRTGVVVLLAIAGYQTPKVLVSFSPKLVKQRLADALLGFLLGAFNGYMIVGTIWWFMIDSGYPFPAITAPQPPPDIIMYLPPEWLTGPALFFAIALAFLFLIVAFL
jgi:uncharacterized membrane protein required for colicin V production